jgi:hypothetical protein
VSSDLPEFLFVTATNHAGRTMQKRMMMALGIALTVYSAARAETPLSPQVLGQVDGILSFCKEIDPRDEQKFDGLRRLLTAGMSKRVLRESDNADYRANFRLVQEAFRKRPRHEAKQLCRDAVN